MSEAGGAERRRAAVYARVSQDKEGAGLAVERQTEDCQELIEERGRDLVQVFADNDTSAYSGKPRPGYIAMLAALDGGEVDAVVAWHPDRLHRSPRELEDFIDAVERAGAAVETCRAGSYDLATPTGRMAARIVGAVARHESEHKSDRIKRKHEQKAKAGEVGGGGRCFGYESDRKTLVPEEADLVREAAGRVLAGETIRGVCKDWTRREIRRPGGSTHWPPTPLRRLLMNPRMAGLRTHHGVIVAEAEWPPILDRVTHERLVRLLGDPARRTNHRSRKYLLTGGLARCGLCSAALVARPKSGGARCYVCASDQRGCGKIRILADAFEESVGFIVCAAVDGDAFKRVVSQARTPQGPDDVSLAGEVETLEAKLSELADAYGRDQIQLAEWLTARDAVEARLSDARRKLDASQRTTDLRAVESLSGALGEKWESLSFDRRRAIIGAVIDHVLVKPAVRGRNRFDVNRLEPVWRV